MAYEVKITNEAALKAAHPDLFSVNERLLKKRLVAAKTLGQTISGAELVKVEKEIDSTPPVIAGINLKSEEGARSFIAEHAWKAHA